MMIFYAMLYLTCKSHNYYYMKVLQGKTNYDIYHKQILPHHICLLLIIINYKIQMGNDESFNSYIGWMKTLSIHETIYMFWTTID
jgi:hypothetical protein